MKNQPESILKMISFLQRVPYLASKNLYKVANYFLEQGVEQTADFCKVLLDATQNVQRCQACFTWQVVAQPCGFCSDLKRNQGLICVVERWPDVLMLEQTGNFYGTYHVLCGVISPLNGIGPNNLTIKHLEERVSRVKPTEVILALSQTPESDATISYILEKLQNFEIKISVLAQGMPIGSSLEYTDKITLSKALLGRKQLL